MHVTGILIALSVGLVIGVLGRVVMPDRQNIPPWLMVVVGVVAALAGTAMTAGL
jgi:uncharacterized membrane protein YeaQ/YmgE (transglycosylase-associated protein family)